MIPLKKILTTVGVLIASAGVFLLALPLILFFAICMLLTGVLGVTVLRYKLSKMAVRHSNDDSVIIEGSYRVE